MKLSSLSLALPVASFQTVTALNYSNPEYTVHPIIREPDVRFENLVIRENGQILTTTTVPNASVYQVDPHGILPTVLLTTVSISKGAVGIAEKEPGLFYFASSFINTSAPYLHVPAENLITELDLRGVEVLPNGCLSKPVVTKTIANLPQATLLNGVAFARPAAQNLLVADTFASLIWNVNISNGAVSIAFNDTTTRGPAPTGPGVSGVNGLKIYNSTMYWSNTGLSALFSLAIDEHGYPAQGAKPRLLARNITAYVDDFVLNHDRTIAYVCGPYNALTRVNLITGEQDIIAGTFNSSTSSLGGPSAARFGKLPTDQNSLYVTTNGGIFTHVENSEGVSRIDLGSN